MLRTLVPVLLALLVPLALLGCGQQGQEPAAPFAIEPATRVGADGASGELPRVALVMKTLTNPFFVEMERGARQAERELGVELRVQTAAQETSIEQQIEIVNRNIHDRVDAIVIAPGDSLELIPVLRKAQESGIRIINIDNRLSPELSARLGLTGVPFISIDNEQAAYRAVRHLAQGITRPTRVAILEGIRGAANAEARKAGALRAFGENPHVRVVAMESANWKIDEGYEITRQLFRQHPQIGALFAANDMMALGALKYLQESGRSEVRVVGFDALAEAREAVAAGQLLVTVDQQAARQGYLGVDYARRALAGESLPGETLVEARLIVAD